MIDQRSTDAPAQPGRRRRGMVGLRPWWRQVRAGPSTVLTIAAAVLLTALILALAPRILQHAAVEDLRAAIEDATPEQRNLRFELGSRLGAGSNSDPFSQLDRRAVQLLEDEVPDTIRPLLRDQQWVVDSPRFIVSSFPDGIGGPFPTTFQLRYQSGIEDNATLIDGAWPATQDPILGFEGPDCPEEDLTDQVTIEAFEAGDDQACAVVRIPVFETVLSEQTAADMGVEVGDQVILTPPGTDLRWMVAGGDFGTLRYVLRISGLIELTDQELEYWYADSRLHRPRITESPDFRFIFAMGLMSPEQYRPLLRAVPRVEFSYTWRYIVDGDAIDPAAAGSIADEFDKIGPDGIDVVTLLPEVLDEHVAQRRLTAQLLAIAGVGLTAAALACVVVIVLVGAARRRAVTALIVDRGASRLQMAADAGLTGTAAAVPAALIGLVVAWSLLRGTDGDVSSMLVLALALAAVATVVIAGTPRRAAAADGDRKLRRLVVEAMVVILAVAAVILVRRRGSDVQAAASGGLNSTLAVAPTLVVLVGAVVTVRLVGPAMRALAAVGARRPGVVLFIGFRRLVSRAGTVAAPLVAVTLASAIMALAAIMLTSLASGREEAALQSIGADYRIQSRFDEVTLPPAFEAEVSAVTTRTAIGSIVEFARVTTPISGAVVDIVAIEAEPFASILADSGRADAAAAGMAELAATVGAGGSDSEPSPVVPGLVVGSWPELERWQVGTAATADFAGFDVAILVVDAVDRVPGVSTARPALLVDRTSLASATADTAVRSNFVLIDGSGVDRDGLADIVDRSGLPADLSTAEDAASAIADDPLSVWTERSLGLVVLAAIAVVIVAAYSGAAIAGVARQRDIGLLTILGIDRRSSARLVLIELLPPVIVAAAIGVAAGGVGGLLLGDALSFGAFSGGTVSAGIVVDRWAVGWPLLVVLGGLVIAAVATMRSQRRVRHGKLIRGEDG